MAYKLKCVGWAIAIAVAFTAIPAHAIRIDLVPAVQSKLVGNAVGVNVVVSDLTAASQIVSAFDLDVTYNPAILNATGVSYGTALGGGGANSFQFGPSFGGGLIDFAESSFLSDADLASLQGNSVTLATLSFQAIGVGISSLQIVQDLFFVLTGRLDATGFPGDLDPSVGGVRVIVSAPILPVPGSLSLIVLGLTVLMIVSRARRHVSGALSARRFL
jgi:hypothetical protein